MILLFANFNKLNAKELFDVNMSKSEILIGNIFSGNSLSIYGIIPDNSYYLILTYKDGVSYSIKKQIRNELGFTKYVSDQDSIEYYGFIDVITDVRNYNDFFDKAGNNILHKYLEERGGISINRQNALSLHDNGIFRAKIYFPKTASPGKYINKMYIFDKQNGEISGVIIQSFDLILDGEVGFLKTFYREGKIQYTLFLIIFSWSGACLISFGIDLIGFYRRKRNNRL